MIEFAENLYDEKGRQSLNVLKAFVKGNYSVVEYRGVVLAYGIVKIENETYTVIVDTKESKIQGATIFDENDSIKAILSFYNAEDQSNYYVPEE